MSARSSGSRPVPNSAPQRISGPAELLQAVPYLLGFHPRRSLVLVGLRDGVLVVTARLDLDDALVAGVVPDTVGALADGGATTLIAAVYDDDVEPFDSPSPGGLTWSGLVAELRQAGAACRVHLADAVAVRGRFWRSYLCQDESCCPAGGAELPDSTSAFVAEATFAGRVPLSDRAAVRALLEPVVEADADRLWQLLADAENAAMVATLAGGRARHDRAEVRALFAAARASDAIGWSAPGTEESARLGAALSAVAVRDALWMGVDDGRIDGRELWRSLARRLPAPYSAAPAFLYGWGSWRAGDGALAGIAAARAIDSDPGYSAADLLLAALSRGVDPRRLPKLRLPRSA